MDAGSGARGDELPARHALLDSPLGPLVAALTPRGLAMLSYADGGEEPLLERLAFELSPRLERDPDAFEGLRREMEEYFGGRRERFETAVDWSLVRGAFARRALRALVEVPYGSVVSYSELAAETGSPRGARAAGNALNGNPIPIVVPYHRVIHADGGIGGYGSGLDRKRFLLALEAGEPALTP